MNQRNQATNERAKLEKRVVVVTGAAEGIGLGVTRRLAEAGYPVAMFDVQEELLKRVVQELQGNDLKVFGWTVDVSNRSQVDAAVQAVREKLGPISIMVTNAGIDGSGSFTDITLESWNHMLAVNLTGTFNCIQSAISDMVHAKWGRIITVSSQAAQSGAPNRAHYVASKGGIIALTKALSYDYAPLGITANTIPPSIIDTPMVRRATAAGHFPEVDTLAPFIPVRRPGTPADIAEACLFLCSDGASFITGQQIGVNGGMYM
jgi:NAD(P)-dependent dehydrogenase (short-subunit alcohol dehydrogenase family)